MAKEPKLPMMPWWPGDYIADTRSMSLAERGAYCDMLFFQWLTGGLPNDVPRQARMLGVSVDEFRAVLPAIRSHFHMDPATGLMVNDRLERERMTSIEMRTKAHVRAKAGGNATRQKWETNPQAMAKKAKTKARVAAHRAKRKAASQATSIAASPADAMPEAMSQARLAEGPPASASASASSAAQRERNSEAESGDAYTHYSPNGRGK
jgi:uncharacterized protein YdaU (DUF1376 family)